MTKPDEPAEKAPEKAPENAPEKASEKPTDKPPEPTVAPLRPRSMQALVLAILAAATLTATDIWAKTWAEENLSRARSGELPTLCEENDGYIAYQRIRGDAHVIVDDMLDLEYAENCGAAFGLMRNAPAIARRVVFGIAAAVAVSALFFLFYQGRGGSLFAWSVPLVASGALGNLIDRIRYGYVVDFIHVHYEPWDFDYPTFNVADITITIGVILLVIDSFRAEPVPAEPVAASSTEAKSDAEPDAEDAAEASTGAATAAAGDETAAAAADTAAADDDSRPADPERA